jgi:hypothetical protein
MFSDEPTRIPSGDECEELCEHSDCPTCGREVTAQYRQVRSTAGVIWLALEVIRLTEKYGVNLPPGSLNSGDLARCYDGRSIPSREAAAWAEGICEALTDTADTGDTYPTVDEREAYIRGVALVAWWREDQKRTRDIASAKANVNAWTAMGLPSPVTPSEFTPCTLRAKVERLGIAYAAGSQEPPSTPPASRGHARDVGPGFESRAQHQPHPSKG